MRQAFQLAFRNLVGAGLRTWLNAIVLAFALIVVVFFNGLIDGWNGEAKRESTAWEYNAGHLYHADLDLHDPFTYLDGHGVLAKEKQEGLTPVLLRSITLYPQGRMVPALLKGIPVDQSIVSLPTSYLRGEEGGAFPVIIGQRMAQTLHIAEGDEIRMRWRDKNSTYDALSVKVAKVFETVVPGVDAGQIWMSLERVQQLTAMEGEVSYWIASKAPTITDENWRFASTEELLQPMTDLINTKKSSGIFMYILFLGIGLLAIFDTQVLSIFRRQKEIGTYIALGMTRWQVVRVFTIEGIIYSFFAVVIAGVLGTPLLWYLAEAGYPMALGDADFGNMVMSDVIYPVYDTGMVVTSALSMMLFATLVSFIPARKIAKLNPILALKGKAM